MNVSQSPLLISPTLRKNVPLSCRNGPAFPCIQRTIGFSSNYDRLARPTPGRYRFVERFPDVDCMHAAVFFTSRPFTERMVSPARCGPDGERPGFPLEYGFARTIPRLRSASYDRIGVCHQLALFDWMLSAARERNEAFRCPGLDCRFRHRLPRHAALHRTARGGCATLIALT